MLGIRAAKSELGVRLPEVTSKPVLKEKEQGPRAPWRRFSAKREGWRSVAEAHVWASDRGYGSTRMKLHTLSLLVPWLQRPDCSAVSDSVGLLGTSPSLSPSKKLPSLAVNHALAYGTNCPN